MLWSTPHLLAVAVALALPPAGSLSVSQTDGLADGQQISVAGTGFPPGIALLVGQCGPPAGTTPRCNEQGGVQPVTTDATGAFGPVPLVLASQFEGVDCAVVACVVLAAPAERPGSRDAASVPLRFGPAAPASGGRTASQGGTASHGGTALGTAPAPQPRVTEPWVPMVYLAAGFVVAALAVGLLALRRRLRPRPSA